MDASTIRDFIESRKRLLSGEKSALERYKRTLIDDKNKDLSAAVRAGSLDVEDVVGPDCHSRLSKSEDDISILSISNSGSSPTTSYFQDKDQEECSRGLPKENFLPFQSSSKSQNVQGVTNKPSSSAKVEKENVTPSNDKFDRDKEIRLLQEKFSVASFWDNFGSSATSKLWLPKTEDNMVRVGEFSPSNPHLQAPGKTHLGLGEYEERRRQLLERKKQEYKEYLSQSRNLLMKTDHFHPLVRLRDDSSFHGSLQQAFSPNSNEYLADAATQTDLWLMQPTVVNSDSAVSVVPSNANGFISSDGFHLSIPSVESPLPSLSPREKHSLELQHHFAPCFVPRAHISQTTEQLPDSRLRQLQLQDELRQQIEEKRRLEAERRERERLEEEALQRRVAEQQARLQAEYEREEQLRSEREKQKQQQMEDFQRRQEELKLEAEQLKREKRQRKQEAAIRQGSQRVPQNAHLVPHSEPAPISILKTSSPPPRSPRRAVSPVSTSPLRLPEQLPQPPPQPPPSPRALIKVLEGPTYPSSSRNLSDTLPIPLMPVAHTYASTSPARRSPSRPVPHSHVPANQQPSDAMRNLENRWKVPAVQKNVCVRERADSRNNNSRSVLTQLGTFRRQLQMEHMRMEEKVRESQHPPQYHQHHYQRHPHQQIE